jgi:hypothetical protein
VFDWKERELERSATFFLSCQMVVIFGGAFPIVLYTKVLFKDEVKVSTFFINELLVKLETWW